MKIPRRNSRHRDGVAGLGDETGAASKFLKDEEKLSFVAVQGHYSDEETLSFVLSFVF